MMRRTALMPSSMRCLGARAAVRIPGRPFRFSNIQQTRVEPNIFMPGSDQESPTRPQPKIFHDFRAPVVQVEGVQRDETIGIRGELLAGPDVPPYSIALRGVR